MPTRKRYRQLKFAIDELQGHYDCVLLFFKLNGQEVHGVLNGSVLDWTFESYSAAFLKIVPSGRLHKYALWFDSVPKQLNKVYWGIWEAATRAGYAITEKEELPD